MSPETLLCDTVVYDETWHILVHRIIQHQNECIPTQSGIFFSSDTNLKTTKPRISIITRKILMLKYVLCVFN